MRTSNTAKLIASLVLSSALVLTALGAASLVYPQILGNGHDIAQGLFDGKLAPLLLVALLFLKPLATIACVRSGNLLIVSGQLCFGSEGKLVAKGQLGGAVSTEDGQKAARACAVNSLAVMVR